MALHINLTIAILFINIFLTLGVTDVFVSQNPFFEKDSNGDFQIDPVFADRLASSNPSENPSLLDRAANVFSGLFLVFDFIGLLFTVLFSSLFILSALPTTVALVLGVPIFIAYGLALIGFIRG